LWGRVLVLFVGWVITACGLWFHRIRLGRFCGRCSFMWSCGFGIHRDRVSLLVERNAWWEDRGLLPVCLWDARIGLVESPYQTMKVRALSRARLSRREGGGEHFCGPRNLCRLGLGCVRFGLGELFLGALGSCGWLLDGLWGDGLLSAFDFVLLFVALGLVWVDAIVTRRGLGRGLRERSPVLRSFINTFGLKGLTGTGILASMLLLFLFAVLNQLEWLLLTIPFTSIMGCVVLMNLKRTG
jgi:hypothetical protein